VIVLEQHGELSRWRGLGRSWLGEADRRYAHGFANSEPVVHTSAATIYPHLTRADDAIHVTFGHALQVAKQEVVQTLALARFVHDEVPDLGLGRKWRRRGGVLRLGRAIGRVRWQILGGDGGA
jgi:hypothetical protein